MYNGFCTYSLLITIVTVEDKLTFLFCLHIIIVSAFVLILLHKPVGNAVARKVLRASGKHVNAQAQEATPTFLRMTGVVTKRTKAQSEYLVLLTAYE